MARVAGCSAPTFATATPCCACRARCAISLFALRSARVLRRSVLKSLFLFEGSIPTCFSVSTGVSACTALTGSTGALATTFSAAAGAIGFNWEIGSAVALVGFGSCDAAWPSTTTTARDTKLVPTPAKNIRASESMTLLPSDATHKGWESCTPVYRHTRFFGQAPRLWRRNVVSAVVNSNNNGSARSPDASFMLEDGWGQPNGPAQLDSLTILDWLGFVCSIRGHVPIGRENW